MAVEREVLEYDIRVLSETKNLEKLEKILGVNLNNLEEMDKVLKMLKGSYLGFASASKRTHDTQKAKQFDDYYKSLRKTYDLLKDIKTQGLTLEKINTIAHPKIEKLNTQTSKPKAKDEIIGKIQSERVTIDKDGNEVIKTTTSSLEKVGDEMADVIRTYIDGFWDSTNYKYRNAGQEIEEKFDPSTFKDYKGEISKFSYNPLIDKYLLTTKEIINNLEIIRKYENGKLVNETGKYKDIKEEKAFDPSTFKNYQGKFYEETYDKAKNQHTLITKETNAGFVTIRKYVNGVEKEQKKVLKDTKNTFEKFMGRVKNIVLYRIVRVIMSAVSQGFKEGFELLRAGDNAFREVNTQLASSAITLKTSLATILLPVVQIISNAISGLSNQLLAVANSMSRANAMAQKQDKYFKLDKKAIDEYAKSLQNAGQLSGLDEFATLSGKPMLGSMVKINDTDGNATKEQLQDVSDTMLTIANIVNGIIWAIKGAVKIIEWISKMSDSTKARLKYGIVATLISVGFLLKPILTTVLIIASSIMMITSIFSSELPLSIKIASASLFALAGIFAAIFIFAKGLTPGLKGLAALISATAFAGGLLTMANGYKNQVDTGSSSITMPNISTSGLNIGVPNEQFSDAVSTGYSQSGMSISGDVYLDREKVGKSVAGSVYNNGVKAGFWRK